MYNPSFDTNNLCESIKTDENLLGFTHLDFDTLGSVEENNIEAIYDTMVTLKTTLLDIANSLPKTYMIELRKIGNSF